MSRERLTHNIGDMVDRLSILSRKIYYGEESAISEHRHLEKVIESLGIDGKLLTNTIRLTQMNFEIWNLEHEFRKDGRPIDEIPVDELAIDGQRARKIRDFNRKRIEYKNLINELLKTGFKETKVNHLSR